jgi:hypothetical protein
MLLGAGGSIVVETLYYEPEDRRFETQWGEMLNLPTPSGRTRPGDLLSLQQKRVSEVGKKNDSVA